MPDLVANAQTSLPPDEVQVRAIQFFTNERWRASTQSERISTFEGRPPIPWLMIIFTIVALFACIVPGIIMYFFVLRKFYRFQNLTISTSPIAGGTEVTITHPGYARSAANRFISLLTPIAK